jgi:erythromycin esterase
MAENVAWWYELTGSKTVVSAHNSHVAYLEPGGTDFTRQGGFLREWFGPGVQAFTVGPPDPGFNEYTLGEVHLDPYFLNLRALPSPAAEWAAQPHPNRFFGGFYEPGYTEEIALSEFSDMLIFIQRSTAARMLPGTPS